MKNNEEHGPIKDQFEEAMELIRHGRLESKFVAFSVVGALEDPDRYDVAIEALYIELGRLLDNPMVGNGFWEQAIALGARAYSRLVANKLGHHAEDEMANRFRQLIKRILQVEHEEILGTALTAMYQDAPLLSLSMIDEIQLIRQQNRKSAERIGFLFDRCIQRIVQVNSSTLSSSLKE